MSEFATIAEVLALTGATVTTAQRSQAAVVIEMTTGLIEGTLEARSDISDRDRYWLRVACAYQAAWLLSQPDFLTRDDVTSLSLDGQSASGKADWLVLSPLARRAMKRLSWRGTRTLYNEPTERDVDAAIRRHALDGSRDHPGEWMPIGSSS